MNEEMYIRKLGYQLELFKQTADDVYTFRCPLCGDSKKSKTKTRGTIYRRDQTWFFGCYNCNEGTTFSKLLQRLNPTLFQEYRTDAAAFKLNTYGHQTYSTYKSSVPLPENIEPVTLFDGLTRVSELEPDHPCVKYMQARLLPKRAFTSTYYADDFDKWSGNLHPLTKSLSNSKRPGIVLPLISETGVEFGYQCRFIGDDVVMRYKTTILDDRFTKAYGMHTIDRDKNIFVLEGYFDACYFPNSIASLDSSLHKTADKLSLSKDHTYLLFDNQPRNTQIKKLMKQAINAGYKVGFFPAWSEQYGKDVNEIVVATKNLKKLVSDITFLQGQKALLKLTTI